MFKKITGSILTIMLMATMFLGASGAAVPQPVHAQEEGYWELTVTIDSYRYNDTDIIGSVRCLTVRTGDGSIEKKEYESNKVTISKLSKRPTTFEFQINEYPHNMKWTQGSIGYYNSEGEGDDSEDVFLGTYTWHYSYKLRYFHYDHIWTYEADGNVITAKCEGAWNCPLADNPTLTLNANGKIYDGKPVTADLTTNDIWNAENGLPEINGDDITYSPDNSKNAGTYTAGYNVGGATATTQFTIEKAPLLIANLKIKDKAYDGTTKATVDTSEAILYGTIPGDDVGYKVTAKFEDADEGWNKPVNLTYELTGADAGNYYIDPKIMEYIIMSLKGTIYAEGKGGPDDYDDYDEDSGSKGSSSGNGKAANASKNSPDTGDANDITGPLAMMLTSAAALGAMGCRRRKENRKQ